MEEKGRPLEMRTDGNKKAGFNRQKGILVATEKEEKNEAGHLGY
jgi:hypothetical protein